MSALEKIRLTEATTDDALKWFDSLAPVTIEFMLGSWEGEEFRTGHAMDGLLEAYRWHGKRFDSAEAADPLVFKGSGNKLVPVNPAFVAPGLALVGRVSTRRLAAGARAFRLVLPLMRTHKARARLRMVSCRGKTSATMIYDQLPINDIFRKVDNNTVLGMMDMKDMSRPYFFILRREGA